MQEIKVGDQAMNSAVPKDKTMVKPLVPSSDPMASKKIIIFIVLIVLGVLTGFALYAKKTAGTVQLAGQDVKIIKTANEEGVEDAATFKDTATGMLQVNDGKVTDEGTHVLVRGDASQNVYLTSSVVDLSKYVGKKVQIWGETFQGRKAGWLMDVGRIKAL